MSLQDGYDFLQREFPKGVTKPVNRPDKEAEINEESQDSNSNS